MESQQHMKFIEDRLSHLSSKKIRQIARDLSKTNTNNGRMKMSFKTYVRVLLLF